MYAIISTENGKEIGMVERPRFIRKSSAGCYIEADEATAQGIAYRSSPYNLYEREGLGAPETVMLIAVDGGEALADTQEQAQENALVSGIAFVTMAEKGDIDGETAGEHASLFEAWAFPIAYAEGNLRRDPEDGNLYKCIQAHTSQEDWPPRLTPALWAKAADPAEEWPEWSQPIGAADAYALGDKVSHNDKHWVSTADNNVWEPGVYGWDEQ